MMMIDDIDGSVGKGIGHQLHCLSVLCCIANGF